MTLTIVLSSQRVSFYYFSVFCNHAFIFLLLEKFWRNILNIKTSEMIRNEQCFIVLMTGSSNSKCTKIITFHFKLMHRQIATSTFLNKIGNKDSDKCSFCENEPEHLLHLFWNFPKTSSFWNNLITWLSLFSVVVKDFHLNSAVALGLRPKVTVMGLNNLCLLIARYFIWQRKLIQRTRDLQCYLSLLKWYKDLDLESNKPASTNKKTWEPLNK